MTRVALLILAFPLAAAAGISAQSSRAIYSRDGSRLLIMCSPHPGWDQSPTLTLHDGRVVNIRDVFPKSGAYDARTLQPIWQVEWYAFEWQLAFSEDFQYVARLNRHGFGDTWALAFYDNGKQTRTYTCNKLLTGLRSRYLLPFSTMDWHTRWYDRFDACDGGFSVHLLTARRRAVICGRHLDLGLRESYMFQLSTGEMYESETTGAWRLWFYGGCAVATIVITAVALRAAWRKLKAMRIRRRRGFEVICQARRAVLPRIPVRG